MILQVHDELVFEVKEESVDKYSKIIKILWKILPISACHWWPR